MKTTIYLSALAMLCGYTSCVKPAREERVINTDNRMANHIDSLVNESFSSLSLTHNGVAISIGVINGDSTYYYNYGTSVKGDRTLPNRATIHEIGSITKTFTAATLTSLLWQDGISLDSPIAGFLPDTAARNLANPGKKVTFRHLLCHTSGLPRIPADLGSQPGATPQNPYAGYDSNRVYSYLANHFLGSVPGTTAEYSNLATGLAGLIIERRYTHSFNDMVQNMVCLPLNMTATGVTPNGTTAKGYDFNGTEQPYWDMAGLKGAGALRSCAGDLIKYARAALGSAPGNLARVMDTCTTVQVKQNGQDLFGLGWEFYYLTNGKRITVKDGGTGGFTSFIAVDRATRRAVVMLCNLSPATQGANENFVRFIEQYLK